MAFMQKKPVPVDKEKVRSLMTRQEVRACIQVMAKEACDRLGGMAEIGDGLVIVDTGRYSVAPSVPITTIPTRNQAAYAEDIKPKARKKRSK